MSRKGVNNKRRSYHRWNPSVFEPQMETLSVSSRRDPVVPEPAEKKLTLFALRLAVLEKAASGLGTLGFIWATVVLLGGFASTLETKDFWVVTLILLVEGARIFSRSQELEWQHQATTWSLASAGRNRFLSIVSSSRSLVKAIFRQSSNDHHNLPKTVPAGEARTQSSEGPILPHVGWVFVWKNVSQMLYWLQLVSAAACAALSLMQLSKQDYGPAESGDDKNKKPALNMFYGLALTEALVFLVERVYWSWKIRYGKLMEQVCRECELGPSGMVSIKRFFYDSYSRCIQGSVFDGLKMDLVSFAEELLDSDSRDEQLIGARILHRFAASNRFSGYTLRKIGTSSAVTERLIEMLNWKNSEEEKIRRSAGEIVSKLAGKKHNAIRVAEVPGSMESITSLLYTGRIYDMKRPHEIGHLSLVEDRSLYYDSSAFRLLGLRILKKLARDHDNCWKMGTAGGLIPMIIDFTSASENLLRNDIAPESQIKMVKRSLQLVKMLVRTTGKTGEMLRKEISEIVFAVSNIRDILQFGERHMVLQKLGIEILTSMAIDKEAREKIGGTGGVIRLLLSVFFQERLTEFQDSVSIEAGEALAVLALGSGDNCSRMLMVGEVIERLVELLGDEVLRVNSSRILMNLCVYSRSDCHVHLRGITAAAPTVLKAILVEKDKLLETSLGLATQIFKFTASDEFVAVLGGAGTEDDVFAKKLVEILERYKYPEIKVPRIRRFVVELAIWMMKSQEIYIHLFKDLGAEEALKDVAETTSDLECFNVFSGSVGLCRDETTVSSLVDTALFFCAKPIPKLVRTEREQREYNNLRIEVSSQLL